MKAKELIEELKKCNPEADVTINLLYSINAMRIKRVDAMDNVVELVADETEFEVDEDYLY